MTKKIYAWIIITKYNRNLPRTILSVIENLKRKWGRPNTLIYRSPFVINDKHDISNFMLNKNEYNTFENGESQSTKYSPLKERQIMNN